MDITQNETSNQVSLLRCRACLSTGRLFSILEYKLADAFALLTGISVMEEKFPQYLCAYCSTRLHNCVSFRDMCLFTQQTLTSELLNGELNVNCIPETNYTFNKFLNLTLTEVQFVECVDESQSVNVPPADKTKKSINVPADIETKVYIDSPIDDQINDSTYVLPDVQAIERIDTADIDISPDDTRSDDVTFDPNVLYTGIDNFIDLTDSNMEYENQDHKRILSISTDELYKPEGNFGKDGFMKTDIKLEFANQGQKTNTNTVETDAGLQKTYSKLDNKNKKHILIINKNNLHKLNVRFVGIDRIIKKTDSKTEYENQKQVLNIGKVKLQYIKKNMKKIKNAIKTHIETPIGDNQDEKNDVSIPGTTTEVKMETKSNNDKLGNVGAEKVKMPVRKTQKNIKRGIIKKKINVKVLCKSRKKSDTKRVKKQTLRRNPENNLPLFDFSKFESTYAVKILTLSKEEQLEEIASRKKSKNYLESDYRCEDCGRGFNMEAAFTNHRARHSPSAGKFPCEICYLRYNRNCTRQMHQDVHRMKFVCNECKFVSTCRDQARRHHAMHAGKTYECQHCGKTFVKPTTYFSHVRIIHPTLNVACGECGETFVSDYGLRMHKARAHGEKPQQFKCTTCSATFLSVEALDRHTDTAGEHIDLRPCEQCGENCTSETALQEHTRETHPKNTFRCDECDMTFPRAVARDTHVRRTHRGVRYTHRSLNTNAARRKGNTYRLKRSMHKEIMCEHCGQLLKTAFQFQCHSLKHQNLKPFACNLCPKTYHLKAGLEVHMRSHTGERPFQCPECPLAFTSKANLNRHHKTAHQGIRDNTPCHICGRLFSVRGSLKLHIDSVHRGLRPPKRDRSKNKRRKNNSNINDSDSD